MFGKTFYTHSSPTPNERLAVFFNKNLRISSPIHNDNIIAKQAASLMLPVILIIFTPYTVDLCQTKSFFEWEKHLILNSRICPCLSSCSFKQHNFAQFPQHALHYINQKNMTSIILFLFHSTVIALGVNT